MAQLIALLAALTALPPAAVAEYTIPPDRSVPWRGNVGSTSTIPSAGKTVDCTKPPYEVPTDGTTDSAGAIIACLRHISEGEVAYLPPGTYAVRRSVYVPSHKTLRGAGMGKTVIRGVQPWRGWGVVGFNADGAQRLGGSVDISGSPRKGSTEVTTATPHHLAQGDHVIIDQLDDPAGKPPVTNRGALGTCTWCGRVSGRSLGQISRVSSVTAPTSFTVEVPLYWNYTSSLAPQVTRQPGLIVDAGVESLTVDNSVVKDRHAALLWYASNCWFYKVEVRYSQREGISLIGYRNTIRSSSVHDTALPLGPNSGYGLWMQTYASANLIENNHIFRTSNPVIINGQASGNVIAYNWLEAHEGNTGRQNGAFSSHGAHPMMNLVEGNYLVGALHADFMWGSSSHYTFFRNRMQLQTPFAAYPQYKYLVEFGRNNTYQNMIGNVLWNRGKTGRYQLNSGRPDVYEPGTYVLGVGDGEDAGADPAVEGTLLRHGNYDYVTKGTVWNGRDDRRLPASLYLTEKPVFLRSAPWPPIGPDVWPMSPERMPWGSARPGKTKSRRDR